MENENPVEVSIGLITSMLVETKMLEGMSLVDLNEDQALEFYSNYCSSVDWDEELAANVMAILSATISTLLRQIFGNTDEALEHMPDLRLILDKISPST